MRYRFEKRRYYYRDKIAVAFDIIVGRINCLMGKHWMKFGTRPFCARCGRRP
jgi:hypothetical protein